MADETTVQGGLNIQVTETGLDALGKKIKKTEEELNSLTAAVQTLLDNLDKVGQTKTIKISQPDRNLLTANIKGVGSVSYNAGRKTHREAAEPLQEEMTKAMQAQINAINERTQKEKAYTALLQKQVANYEHNQSQYDKKLENNRIMTEAYAQRQKDNSEWYKYRSAHPEEFTNAAQRKKTQTASNIMTVTGAFKDMGTTGKIISGIGEIAGAGMLGGPYAAVAVAVAKLTQSIISLGKESLQAFGEIETIRTQLGVVFPTQAQAGSTFTDIAAYATKSPFGVEQTSEMAVLLKQSGVYASDLMDTLKIIGDTAGGNEEKMKRIANNYAQIVSIGKASMLDMRQFAYAGIPIFEKVSKELGVSQSRLRSMISDGKVTAEVISKVFSQMTSEGGIFENATEQGAKTYKAKKQNLSDTRQLATSEVGEFFYNLGNNEVSYKGVGEAILSSKEKFWEGLYNWGAIANIERNVDNIANRNSEIEKIEKQLKYEKENGGDDAVIYKLERRLKALYKEKDPDEERSELNESYQARTEMLETLISYSKNPEFKNLDFVAALQKGRSIVNNKKDVDQLGNQLSSTYRSLAQLPIAAGSELGTSLFWISEYYKQYQKYLKKDFYQGQYGNSGMALYKNGNIAPLSFGDWLTMDSYASHIEVENLSSQQSAIDTTDKAGDSTSSLINDANQIREILESSEEYKQKEQEKLIAKLEESRKTLLDIATYTKEGTDIIDINEVSGKKLQEWISQGALSARKLALVASDKNANEDWTLLQSQIGNVRFSVEDLLGSGLQSSSDVSRSLLDEAIDILSPLDKNSLERFSTGAYKSDSDRIKAFYDYFNKNYYEAMDAVNKKLEDNVIKNSPEQLSFWQGVKEQLSKATLEFTVDASNLEGDLNQDKDKSKAGKEFIPLWKRVISNALGVPVGSITSSQGAFSAYTDDLSVRSSASNMIKTLLSNGYDFSSVQSILTSKGVGTINQGDSGITYQIDWKSVKDNLKSFALTLSASTDIIDSYKSSLEEQYNSYITLAQGLTTNETEDVTSAVIYKSIGEAVKSDNNALINAFGENLTTVDGVAATIEKQSDGTYKIMANGLDVTGQQLKLNGNIFEFLKEEMPKIRKEIEEANKTSLYNKIYQNLTAGTNAEYLNKTLLLSSISPKDYAALSQENKDLFVELLKKNLENSTLVGTDKKYKSVNDLVVAANGGNKEAQNEVKSFATDLVNNAQILSDFAGLTKQNSKVSNQTNARTNIENLISNPSAKRNFSLMSLIDDSFKNPNFQKERDFGKTNIAFDDLQRKVTSMWRTLSASTNFTWNPKDIALGKLEDMKGPISALGDLGKSLGSVFTNPEEIKESLSSVKTAFEDYDEKHSDESIFFNWNSLAPALKDTGENAKELFTNQLPKFLQSGFNSIFNVENNSKGFSQVRESFVNWFNKTFTLDNIQKQADNFKKYVNDELFKNLLKGAGLSEADYEDMLLLYRDLVPKEMLTSPLEKDLHNQLTTGVYDINYQDLQNAILGSGVDKSSLWTTWNNALGALYYFGDDYKYRLTSKFDENDNLVGFEAQDATDTESAAYAAMLNQNIALEKQAELKRQLVEVEQELYGNVMLTEIAYKASANTMKQLGENFKTIAMTTAQNSWIAPFKTLGNCLVTGEDAADALANNMKSIAAEMLSQMGSYMAQAGFSLVAYGAKSSNVALILAGLGLAAAGGFASGLGGALNSNNTDKTEDETEKLESLKDKLEQLLEQARTDALYYENNLRHKTALGINSEYSHKTVNDAIIAPNGNVISTAPDDYLIATKTPESFAKSGSNVNFTVNNYTSAKVDVQKQIKADGTVDFVAQIYDVMDSYIASERSDEAFSARQFRVGGRSAVR